MTNGINGTHDGVREVGLEDSHTQRSTGTPPPIDAVDIGIVSEELQRQVQAGGPPPRSLDDVNPGSEVEQKNSEGGQNAEEEDKENIMKDVE